MIIVSLSRCRLYFQAVDTQNTQLSEQTQQLTKKKSLTPAASINTQDDSYLESQVHGRHILINGRVSPKLTPLSDPPPKLYLSL